MLSSGGRQMGIPWFQLLYTQTLFFNEKWRKISEKAMAPHSSTLAWQIPWTEEPGRLQSMGSLGVGSLGVGHDWATSLSLSRVGEGNGNPLQCSCLENPMDRGAWWPTVQRVAKRHAEWLSTALLPWLLS